MNEQVETIRDWLVAYIAQTVGSPVDDIGENVPFARYGLDSAATVVMASELMDWLGRDIDLDTVYEYPTVDALSRQLAGEAGER
jgi:acyl carrier protein